MTTTILAAFVLSGALAPNAKPEFAAQTDYGQAMQQAVKDNKPMVVLIGKGDVFAKMLADATMPESATALLREKYVCVNVDVTTPEGAKLADQFQLKDGVVISSAGGSYQALRQGGSVTPAEFAKHLTTYANGPSIPTNTVTLGTAPVVTTPSTHPIYSTSPTAPVYPTSGYVSPSFYPSYYPGTRCVGNR